MKKYNAPLAVRQLAKEISKPSLPYTFISLFLNWSLIFGAGWFSRLTESWFVYGLGVLIIASRQHALLVLMHEGSHGAFCAKKVWNDRMANWFTAWPLGISTEAYRLHHWKHHRYTNTVEDPDWGRKIQRKEWQFPKSKREFLQIWLPYLWGKGILEMGFAIFLLGKEPQQRFSVSRMVYFSLLISSAWYLMGPLPILHYWVIPFFTVLPLLMKVRSIVEHLGLPNTEELNGTRNILANPLERFFFGPHANHLHLVHHLFPQVPWHQLQKLQDELSKDPHYLLHAHQNDSYFFPSERSVWKDLLKTSSIEGQKKDPVRPKISTDEKTAA